MGTVGVLDAVDRRDLGWAVEGSQEAPHPRLLRPRVAGARFRVVEEPFGCRQLYALVLSLAVRPELVPVLGIGTDVVSQELLAEALVCVGHGQSEILTHEALCTDSPGV